MKTLCIPSISLVRHDRKLSGFSLVEMAVVIVLMGILMSFGLRTLRATQDSAAFSETRSKQDRIKVALISFLRTNGRLPCPDVAALPTGIEPAAGCTAASGYGVLPWASLGLAREVAVDGWSNFFTYRVATANPAPDAPGAPLVPRAQNRFQNWTLKTAAGFNILSLTSPTSGGFLSLQIDQRSTTGVIGAVAYNAVVVVYSHGKTGGGARTLAGTVIAAPTGADEIVNNTAGSTRFIVRDFTENPAAAGGIYDDVVSFITPQDLLQPMLDDKTLKGVGASYRDLVIVQLGVSSCTPPEAGVAQPLVDAIIPTAIGNGVITYSCSMGDFCQTATPVQSGPPVTAGAQVLYRLSLFGAAAQTVTYAQLQAAYPAIQTLCP